jgi:hypothetical protein
VLVVLAGTYDLAGLIHLNGQLSRRTEIVHFARYGAEGPDFEAFVNVLRDLEAHVAIETFSFEDNWDVLYNASLGRVGTLKRRIYRGMAKALAAGRGRDIADLMLNQAEHRGLANEREEISEGERSFSTEPAFALGETEPIVPPAETRADLPALAPAGQRVPFQRTPKRDPVGPRGRNNDAAAAVR